MFFLHEQQFADFYNYECLVIIFFITQHWMNACVALLHFHCNGFFKYVLLVSPVCTLSSLGHLSVSDLKVYLDLSGRLDFHTEALSSRSKG